MSSLKERLKTIMAEEGVGTIGIEDALREILSEAVLFSSLPRDEQIDYFINRFSGNEFEAEIAEMISSLAAYTNGDHAKLGRYKHNWFEYSSDELGRMLNDDILNVSAGGFDGEEKAWNLIIDTLGTDLLLKIFNDQSFRESYTRAICEINEKHQSALRKLAESYLSAQL